jgi:alpha-beta hydrolase superfamily lysophospholipase
MQQLEVNLITSDDVPIAGFYIPGSLPAGVVLLHMMPADKSSYADLASKLGELGLHVLAIDLRGHGESGGGDYQEFNDEQHKKSIFDVMAAVEYLRKQSPNVEIGFIGASIGASLAMQFAAANEVKFLVLLSPGLKYRGIETGPMAAALPESLPTFFVSAMDDDRVPDNASQTETLFNFCASQNKQIKILRHGGHGTNMLQSNAGFTNDLLEWIKNLIR